MRDVWRFAIKDIGGLCAMTFGIDWMLRWYVDSLDMEQMVNFSFQNTYPPPPPHTHTHIYYIIEEERQNRHSIYTISGWW